MTNNNINKKIKELQNIFGDIEVLWEKNETAVAVLLFQHIQQRWEITVFRNIFGNDDEESQYVYLVHNYYGPITNRVKKLKTISVNQQEVCLRVLFINPKTGKEHERDFIFFS